MKKILLLIPFLLLSCSEKSKSKKDNEAQKPAKQPIVIEPGERESRVIVKNEISCHWDAELLTSEEGVLEDLNIIDLSASTSIVEMVISEIIYASAFQKISFNNAINLLSNETRNGLEILLKNMFLDKTDTEYKDILNSILYVIFYLSENDLEPTKNYRVTLGEDRVFTIKFTLASIVAENLDLCPETEIHTSEIPTNFYRPSDTLSYIECSNLDESQIFTLEQNKANEVSINLNRDGRNYNLFFEQSDFKVCKDKNTWKSITAKNDFVKKLYIKYEKYQTIDRSEDVDEGIVEVIRDHNFSEIRKLKLRLENGDRVKLKQLNCKTLKDFVVEEV